MIKKKHLSGLLVPDRCFLSISDEVEKIMANAFSSK
ncbi:hypothetical protein [Staphylococcus argenteus]|nr:hypothetical protein [Staphylococcus argenteus]API80426.1 hypothetical protein A7971_12475 [Staphylococcus argenteus]MBE2123088.1 hypothetical protein [Staphylococcus argenteus]MBE2141777.1 hypothetical protein [Staphylococcus argenteus]MCG6476205.1 hypothetical protein [Staphylococcus argenteus]MCG9806611.1 hypothetical protein [Staphylococcus argenteus]